MKPKLKSYCINDLGYSGTLAIPRDLISTIETLAPPNKDQISVFMESYTGHHGLLYLHPIDTGGQEQDIRKYYLNCQYSVRGGRPKRNKGIPQPQQLLVILSTGIGEVTLDCRVDFLFLKRSQRKTLMNLPLTPWTIPKMPFNRINGIHVAKMNGKESEYEVVLDVVPKTSVWVSIRFRYQSTIDNHMSEKVIEKALSICSLFVSQEEADAESKGC